MKSDSKRLKQGINNGTMTAYCPISKEEWTRAHSDAGSCMAAHGHELYWVSSIVGFHLLVVEENGVIIGRAQFRDGEIGQAYGKGHGYISALGRMFGYREVKGVWEEWELHSKLGCKKVVNLIDEVRFVYGELDWVMTGVGRIIPKSLRVSWEWWDKTPRKRIPDGEERAILLAEAQVCVNRSVRWYREEGRIKGDLPIKSDPRVRKARKEGGEAKIGARRETIRFDFKGISYEISYDMDMIFKIEHEGHGYRDMDVIRDTTRTTILPLPVEEEVEVLQIPNNFRRVFCDSSWKMLFSNDLMDEVIRKPVSYSTQRVGSYGWWSNRQRLVDHNRRNIDFYMDNY